MLAARSLAVVVAGDDDAAAFRIAETGGPRCCKRTGRLCIREAAAFTAERFGVEMPLGEIACTYMKENRECIGRQCPFFPARGKEADA